MMVTGPEDCLAFRAFAGALIGLILGSFATMASYRLPRKLSIVAPPSACPCCGHRLGACDLIPVFSWLFQGCKCRYCRTPIPARYPLIELATALATTLLFMLHGLNWTLIPLTVALCAIIIAAIIRLERAN